MTFPGAAFINGRLSMGARLGLLSAVFCAPIALLAVMFVTECRGNIEFAKKEVAGAQYLASMRVGSAQWGHALCLASMGGLHSEGQLLRLRLRVAK